jgi:Fe2+ transport system protein FeoA
VSVALSEPIAVPAAVSSDVEVRISVAAMRPGQVASLCSSDLPPAERRLLRAMGLRDGTPITVCRRGQPCIVRVMGACAGASRIGMSRPLAERVFVRVARADAPATHG